MFDASSTMRDEARSPFRRRPIAMWTPSDGTDTSLGRKTRQVDSRHSSVHAELCGAMLALSSHLHRSVMGTLSERS